jgi:hypothetical protein
MPIKTTTKDGRPWVQAGWHCYSHFFAEPDHYECPGPGRVREILVNPPGGRFLLTINPSGKKHTLFRGHVSTSRDILAVHFEDETFLVHSSDVARCMAEFEGMSRLGFSKEQTITGRYSQYQILQAGLDAWHDGEAKIAAWRVAEPSLLGLIAWCANGPGKFKDEVVEPKPAIPPLAIAAVTFREDLFG